MNRTPAGSHRARHLDSLGFPVPEVLASFPVLPSICSPPVSFHHFSLFRGSAPMYLSRGVLSIATTLSNVLDCWAQVRKSDSTLIFFYHPSASSSSCSLPPSAVPPTEAWDEALGCSPLTSLALLLTRCVITSNPTSFSVSQFTLLWNGDVIF